LVQGIEGRLEIREITHPVGSIHLPDHMNLYPERVTVQSCASMSGWDVWQLVSRLKAKLFEDFHLFQV
jgi:hypothetical protein